MFDKLGLVMTSIIILSVMTVMYPIQTISTAIAIGITYFIIKNIPNTQNYKNEQIFDTPRIRARQHALKSAYLYLSPYNDIWKNLELKNSYLTVKLDSTGIGISAQEQKPNKRMLLVINSKVHTIEKIWEMLCYRFDHQLTFDGLLEFFERSHAEVYIDKKEKVAANNEMENLKVKPVNTDIKIVPMDYKTSDKQIDINNASEEEISSLPGISVIMTKKIIKKRNEIMGFKNKDELFKFLKLNSHIQEQIRPLIIIKEIKRSKVNNRSQERRVDL